MYLLSKSGGGATTDYETFTLNSVGATAPSSVHIKAGETVVITSHYGYIAYYKNDSATLTANSQVNTDKQCIVVSSGDFMYLGGHNYAGAYLCLKEGDYKFYNNSIAAKETYVVPNN